MYINSAQLLDVDLPDLYLVPGSLKTLHARSRYAKYHMPKNGMERTASCGVSLVPSGEERKSQQMAEGTRENQQLGRRDSLSDSRYHLEVHSAREKFQSSTTFRPLFQTSQILQTHVMLKKPQARGPRPTRSESKLLSRCFSTMGGLNGISASQQDAVRNLRRLSD